VTVLYRIGKLTQPAEHSVPQTVFYTRAEPGAGRSACTLATLGRAYPGGRPIGVWGSARASLTA